MVDEGGGTNSTIHRPSLTVILVRDRNRLLLGAYMTDHLHANENNIKPFTIQLFP